MDFLLRRAGRGSLPDTLDCFHQRVGAEGSRLFEKRSVIVVWSNCPKPPNEDVSGVDPRIDVVYGDPKPLFPVDERPVQHIPSSVERQRSSVAVNESLRGHLDRLGPKNLVVRHRYVEIRRVGRKLFEKGRPVHVFRDKKRHAQGLSSLPQSWIRRIVTRYHVGRLKLRGFRNPVQGLSGPIPIAEVPDAHH
jgi:hypothetical protein